MKIRKPDYYDQFQCIAGACKDSCCIGWEIDVDEEKRAYYRKVDGALGERLQRCIDWEEGHFILQGKEERCPFLNGDGLCDLIIGLGEESLCEICREHPRYYDWFDGLTEAGVGLACEAAAGLILEGEEPVRFVEEIVPDESSCRNAEEDGEKTEGFDDSDENAEVIGELFAARDRIFHILQDRRFTIWERLDRMMEELNLSVDERAELTGYRNILSICRELEPIDETWPAQLDGLEQLIAQTDRLKEAEQAMLAQTASREYEYENLAVYFIYRHFMKCRYDGAAHTKGMLCVFCMYLIRLLDTAVFLETGTLTKEDRAQNAKNCSKEIEYSEDNLELLEDMFWEWGLPECSAE